MAVMSSSYGSVVLTLDNVLLPKDKLCPTPSSLDGLDEETEKDLRITGCELIQTSGILLKLPQTAMATGQVLFQRYYYSKSFVRQSMETSAMACVYLASKIEEAPRRIRDVINVFHHIRLYRAKKPIQPLILDPAYIRLKSDVTLAERRILKELGFCVHVKHPHKLIVIYIQQLGFGRESKFIQKAWNYMNDALRTNVFVVHTPEAIACACICLGSRILNIALPDNWFGVFDIPEEDVLQISFEIMDLYERPVVNYEELERKIQVLIKAYQESRQKIRIGDKPASQELCQSRSPIPVNSTSAPEVTTTGSGPNAATQNQNLTSTKIISEKRSNGTLTLDGLANLKLEVGRERKSGKEMYDKEDLERERDGKIREDREDRENRDREGKRRSRSREGKKKKDRDRDRDRERDRERDGDDRRREEKRRREKDRRERERSKDEKRRRYY